MTNIEFIKNRIESYEYGTPIYSSVLADELSKERGVPVKESAAAVAVAMKRIVDNDYCNDLRCYQKGVYYRSKATPFGETGLNKDIFISDKYLTGNNGYETGLALLHHMGLTTQMPTERVFVTNKAVDCIRKVSKLGISICPPKIKINKNNKLYLQTLDAIDAMRKAPVDADNPWHIIADHIKENDLDYGELLSLAGKHYNKNTVLALAQVAGERG